MHKLMSLFIAAFLVAALHTTAQAQGSVIVTPNTRHQIPAAGLTNTDIFRLRRAEQRSRAARNGLIGSSVATAVGLVLMISAAPHCEEDDTNFHDDIDCTDTGVALLGSGGILFTGGAIGMITTGIMLGRRNRRQFRIEDQIYPRRSGFHWDIKRGKFVF